MGILTLFLLVAALVCFLMATFGFARIAVGWLGLAFLTIVELANQWPK